MWNGLLEAPASYNSRFVSIPQQAPKHPNHVNFLLSCEFPSLFGGATPSHLRVFSIRERTATENPQIPGGASWTAMGVPHGNQLVARGLRA